MKTLVIADSRGAHIAPILQATKDIGETKVVVNPGATILNAVQTARGTITTFQPDLIVVIAGICNITKRNRNTRMISLKHNNVDGIITEVMDEVVKARAEIERTSGAWISFATVTGTDLTDVNNHGRRTMTDAEYRTYVNTVKIPHPDQGTLDNALFELNRRITAHNNIHHTPTTWMAEVVHPYLRGQHRSYYTRLRDGCHPTPNTRTRWAHQIARTVRRTTTAIEAKYHKPTTTKTHSSTHSSPHCLLISM